MSHLHVKYLLVGGGLASSSAAQAIRQRDSEGSIYLIGVEPTRPYHRPPLSKAFLRWDQTREELFTVKTGWFSENHVELRTGLRASRLDAARHQVALDNGDEIAFDKLLIATGASPRQLSIPGSKLPNVHYLRSLHDAERLHHSIEKAKREGKPHDRGRGRVAVVGGGLLGVELAGSLTQLGLAVDLAVSGPHPWAKFGGESTGNFLAKHLETHGVGVHLNASPDRFEGEGRAQRVVLRTGEVLPCDLVVVAIGSLVNKDLLRGSPIAAEKAILTDDQCLTNAPDIYAAGDCAAVFDPLFGKHRVLDHWDNAVVTGRLAGRNMAGADEHYDAVNYFFSDVFDLHLSAWGESRHISRRLMRGVANAESPDFVEIGIGADNRINQVLAVGPKAEDNALRELVRRRLPVDGNQELLKDPSTPLSALLQ